MYLTVIIPCYNEERNIRLGVLENVAHFLNKKTYDYEVVIVDDESVDESKKLIKQFITDHSQFRLIVNKHMGKGASVITGMQKAKGEYILFTDMDQATPINQIDKLLPYFSKGYAVVIGSRKDRRKGAPLFRRAMAKGFMILRNVILNLNIDDTQCGFKAFTYEAAQKIFQNLKVYKADQHYVSGSTVTAGFDVEVLYVAKNLGFKIIEVAVEWHYQETRRVNPIKDSWEGLIDLIKIQKNSISGIYELHK